MSSSLLDTHHRTIKSEQSPGSIISDGGEVLEVSERGRRGHGRSHHRGLGAQQEPRPHLYTYKADLRKKISRRTQCVGSIAGWIPE